jgi:hypothetical protein
LTYSSRMRKIHEFDFRALVDMMGDFGPSVLAT